MYLRGKYLSTYYSTVKAKLTFHLQACMWCLTCIRFLTHTVSLKMVEKSIQSDKQSVFHMPAKDVTVLCLSPPALAPTSGVWVRSPGVCRWSHALSEPPEQPRLMKRHDCWHLALQLVNGWMSCSQFSGWLCRHMLYHDACIQGGELRLHSIYECIRIHMWAALQSKAYASMR